MTKEREDPYYHRLYQGTHFYYFFKSVFLDGSYYNQWKCFTQSVSVVG